MKAGIYLLIFPKTNIRSELVSFDVSLLNYLGEEMNYEASLSFRGETAFETKGELEDNSFTDIANLLLDQLNDSVSIDVSTTFKIDGWRTDASKIIKLRPKLAIKKPEFCEAVDAKAHIFPCYIVGEEPSKPEPIPSKLRGKILRPVDAPKPDRNYIWEVNDRIDLHIEKLVDDPTGITNGEIVDIQLRTLEQHIERAIAHNLPRLLVIHGQGRGVLKARVHDFCRQHPMVHHYELASPWVYGEGITEVTF